MDFLRQQLATVNERLAGLSATQKLLAGALAVIVVMTMLYWGRSASNTEMVVLMPSALTGTDLTNVTSALSSHNITYTTNSAGQLMVPASQQSEAMMNISFNGVLGGQSVDNFAAMMANWSPLDSENKTKVQVNHYTEQSLAQIIEAAPGVQKAYVKVNYPPQMSFAPVSPTAYAAIYTKPGATMPKRKLAEGAANALAVCLGIERAKVGVSVDGVDMHVTGPDGANNDFDPNDLIATKQHWEEVYSSMVRSAYSDIRGLIVTVNVDVDNESSHNVLNGINPEHKFSGTVESTSERSSSTEAAPPPTQEPGVTPNTAVSLNGRAAAGGTPGSTVTEKTTERNTVEVEKYTKDSYKSAGDATPRAISIRVPPAYFISLWKAEKNDPKANPTGDEYSKFLQTELETMRTRVRHMIPQIEDDTAVTASLQVEMPMPVDDSMATGGPMLATADATGGGSLKVLATGHAKDVAVGVLALASLFMVGRMVKKSAPPAPEPILALDNDATPLAARTAATSGALAAKVRSAASTIQTIGGAEELAGDVLESGPVLMGQELDEAILETSQMVDQVGSFVKDNPEMAAQLLSRWMSRE